MMIPAGYMYKRTAPNPGWFENGAFAEIYSASACVSDRFCDYIHHWMHNGFWFFDRPQIMHEVAEREGVELDGFTLLYYEAFEQQFDEKTRAWEPLGEMLRPLKVKPPAHKQFHGFDIACFQCGNQAECSPLACNSLWRDAPVNDHCLLATLEQTKEALESDLFKGAEPGPYRILAVYTCEPGEFQSWDANARSDRRSRTAS